MNEHHDPDDALGPSKSAVKREAHAAQKLGEGLVGLDAEALDTLPVSDRLRDAIEAARAIRARGARKRQMQYIGRLMREEDVEAIEGGLRRLDPDAPENRRITQQAEDWRDALIEDRGAITRFVEAFPEVDVQQLRRLQRGARAEANEERYGKAARALFEEVRARIRTKMEQDRD
jgi:ribosome-associated protein